MKKFVAELIGTFMLVFIGTGAVVFGNGLDGLGHLGIAFAFGLAIVVAAYSIGTISGAHLNPAVSIAMFVNKTFVIFRACKLHPWTSSWSFYCFWRCLLPLG